MKRVAWVGLLLTACTSNPPPAAPVAAAPQAFVTRLLAVLEHGDDRGWRDLLSERMRARVGNDAALLHDQLVMWRRDLLPLAATLRDADLSIAANALLYSVDGGEPAMLATVALEGGTLHLDDN